MPRKPSTPPPAPVLGRPELEAGIRKLRKRIEELEALDIASITERWDARASALESKVETTLTELFGYETPEYNRHSIGYLDSLPVSMTGEGYSAQTVQRSYREGVRDAVIKLKTVIELLQERLEKLPSAPVSESVPAPRQSGNRVFIVHGRDEAAKEMVARFVAKLGLEPLILHEQPNAGRTIIEKLEGHLDVDFAIVLLTPDDVGGLAGAGLADLQSRARQNVVLELGLFLGALGRKRVCALHKGDLELPSDFDGVVYVSMDDGSWRLLLAREMKEAGLGVDLNKAM